MIFFLELSVIKVISLSKKNLAWWKESKCFWYVWSNQIFQGTENIIAIKILSKNVFSSNATVTHLNKWRFLFLYWNLLVIIYTEIIPVFTSNYRSVISDFYAENAHVKLFLEAIMLRFMGPAKLKIKSFQNCADMWK